MNPPDDTNTLTDLFQGDPDDQLPDSSRDVGRRILEAREAAGLDRPTVASQLGVEPATIEAWEAGTETPSGHRLSRLAGLLGVSLTWIMVAHGTEPVDRDQAIADLRAAIVQARSQITDTLEELESRLDLLTG